ncbi:MAG: phosphate acyltransferase PlsX [Planctomycetota bacterium]
MTDCQTVEFFIDLMGGDYAPEEIVKGVEKYLSENSDTRVSIKLFALKETAQRYADVFKNNNQVEWHISESFMRMGDKPIETLQHNNKTTIEMALVEASKSKNGVVISAGNTGGFVASSVLTLGVIEGIRRPAIISTIPTANGQTAILDLGANTEPKTSDLLMYAKIGKIYVQNMLDKKKVSIGLLNVGEEKGKGPKFIQEAYQLLKKEEEDFVGNIEGNEIFRGVVDVAICDGFVGNILLKWGEGLFELIKNKLLEKFEELFKNKAGISISEKWAELLKLFDYKEYGGALLLGVNGYCIVCHGRSKQDAIANAIKKGYGYVKSGILDKIRKFFAQEQIATKIEK